MILRAALLLAAVLPSHHPAEAKPAKVHKPHRLGPHFTVGATAYTPCSSGSRMADGHSTYFGAVASNRHPLGTLLRFDRRLFGRRWFRVRDHIGSGTSLDIWMADCRAGVQFGRRSIGYRTVRP